MKFSFFLQNFNNLPGRLIDHLRYTLHLYCDYLVKLKAGKNPDRLKRGYGTIIELPFLFLELGIRCCGFQQLLRLIYPVFFLYLMLQMGNTVTFYIYTEMFRVISDNPLLHFVCLRVQNKYTSEI